MRRARRLDDGTFTIERREVPSPGPDGVLVRVGASVVASWEARIGARLRPDGRGRVAGGHQFAGWIAEVGRLVVGWEPGESVAVFGGWGCGVCPTCLAGEEQLCPERRWPGIDVDGGHADYVLVPASRHLVHGGDLEPVDVAPLAAALPAYRTIRRHGGSVRPGSTAVVVGVGAHGHFAIQLLRALTSASIVAIDDRPERRSLAVAVGADIAIDPSGADVAAELERLTGGERASLVFDFGGTDESLARALDAASDRAVIVTPGLDRLTLPPAVRQPHELTLLDGVWGNRAELADVVALARSGRIAAWRRVWSLDDIDAAAAEERRGTGPPSTVVVP